MPISVPFVEHEDSPKESGERNGTFKFVRIFVTAWDDRWTFLRELFTGGTLGYPMTYPGWPAMFADSFEIDFIATNPRGALITDPATQIQTHATEAKITVNYAPLVLEDGQLISYEMQEAGEFVTVPSRGLKWFSDGRILQGDIAAAYPTATTRHVVTWHQVSNPPWTVMATTINKVNSVAFRVPVSGQIFVPGTLLFAERSASISLNWSGLTTWKFTLTFLEKAQTSWTTTGTGPIGGSPVYGWNHQWREDTGDFDKPICATTGATTFQTADFRALFQT